MMIIGITALLEMSMKIDHKKMAVVLDSSDGEAFENDLNMYIGQGYKISSSSCGFVSSERYDFCASYQAVLVFDPQ